MTLSIRAATAADGEAVDALLRACFAQPGEARLVAQLAIDGDLVLAMVADDEAAGIVGMVAASRMRVDADGAELAAVAIAPLAVAVEHRRTGIAELLVDAAIERLRTGGATLAFVLGEPGYYGRFGFRAESASGFASPYAGPFLLAMRLNEGRCIKAPGAALHAQAFAALARQAVQGPSGGERR
jgi:putative acetyltransferase